MTTIIGIRLGNRNENSTKFQETLTEYGCIIKTRLGLHDVSGGKCPTNGIILLEVIDEERKDEFINKLKNISEIKVEIMEI